MPEEQRKATRLCSGLERPGMEDCDWDVMSRGPPSPPEPKPSPPMPTNDILIPGGPVNSGPPAPVDVDAPEHEGPIAKRDNPWCLWGWNTFFCKDGEPIKRQISHEG